MSFIFAEAMLGLKLLDLLSDFLLEFGGLVLRIYQFVHDQKLNHRKSCEHYGDQ